MMKNFGKTTATAGTILTVFSLNANKGPDKTNLDQEVLNTQGVEITIHATTVGQTNDATFTGFNDAVEDKADFETNLQKEVGLPKPIVAKASGGDANGISLTEDIIVISLYGGTTFTKDGKKYKEQPADVYAQWLANQFSNPDVVKKPVNIMVLYKPNQGTHSSHVTIDINGDEYKNYKTLHPLVLGNSPEIMNEIINSLEKSLKKENKLLPVVEKS